jgi:hypothetical protein
MNQAKIALGRSNPSEVIGVTSSAHHLRPSLHKIFDQPGIIKFVNCNPEFLPLIKETIPVARDPEQEVHGV